MINRLFLIFYPKKFVVTILKINFEIKKNKLVYKKYFYKIITQQRKNTEMVSLKLFF